MLTRRELLKRMALLTGGAVLPWRGWAATTEAGSDKLGPLLPQRLLGRTGMKVTMLGCGGSHLGRPAESVAQAVIETALEEGVRVFDTAQLYQGGGSEDRLGRFLPARYREHVLIFSKTMAVDAATARQHLDASLRRLRTDYLDLWQLHDVRSPAQAEERVAGVLDVMREARAAGRVRHIGFTGHATWKAHKRVLELTNDFETCLMPINIADPSYESFILNILPILLERGMGVQAMKTLGGDGLIDRRGTPGVVPSRVPVADALRFVWSLPVGVLISGMASVAHLRANVATAREFLALDEEQRTALVERVADIASTGAPRILQVRPVNRPRLGRAGRSRPGGPLPGHRAGRFSRRPRGRRLTAPSAGR